MNKLVALLIMLAAAYAPTLAQAARFTIQVASAPNESEARTLLAQLAAAGLPAYAVKAEVQGAGERYRVRFGLFPNRAAAKVQAERALSKQAIKEYLVITYETPSFTTPPISTPTPTLTRSTSAAIPVNFQITVPSQFMRQTVEPLRARAIPLRTGTASGRVVRWTLREALLAALEKNVDIELERGNVRLAQYDLLAARGVYDRTLTTGVFYDALTQANTRLFSGTNANATQSRSLTFSHGLRQQLQRGGGSWQLDFDNQRNTNNFSTLSPLYNPRLSLSFTQPLFRNFKVDAFRRQLKITKKRLDLSDAVFRQRVIEIVSQTQQAYWDLALALKNEELQRDSAKLAEEQLRLNQRQVELGTQSELEVVQAASALETRRQQVFQAMELVVQAENTLKALTIGAPGDELAKAQLVPVEAFTARPFLLPLEDALKLAQANRPELRQLALQQESNRIELDFFRDQLKPQIDLVGSYALLGVAGSKNSGLVTAPPTCVNVNPPDTPGCIPPFLLGAYPTALGNLFRNDFRSWQVGVNITLPWGNRVNKANLGRAREQERQLGLQTQRALRNIELEVRNAVQSLATIKLRIDAARTATEFTQQQLAGERKKFEAGLSTTFLVLQRQNELALARATEVRALADYNQTVAQLQRILSTTLSDNGIEITSELQSAEKKPYR